MRFNVHLSNPAIFAMLWLALSALVLHDIMLHQASARHFGKNVVSERVVTREFVLVDDNGHTRARIGMNDNTQAPSVQLFDSAGNQRAQLRLNKEDVPSLRLYDAKGSLKSVVGFTLNDMQPAYVTFDNNGLGHIENTNRPNSYQIIHDEDAIPQTLSLGQPFPNSQYLSLSRQAAMHQEAAELMIRVEAARDRANAASQKELIEAEVQDAQAQVNALNFDPFQPKNKR